MSDFVSNVKIIPYPQEEVYAKLSEMNILERIKERLNDPSVKERIQQEADKYHVGDVGKRLDSLTFDRDSLSIGGSPLGNLSLHIIEREAPKTIKMEGQGAPVALNMWIQLLPIDAMTCKLRVTVRAELNMFIKAMVSKPLQSGVENIANILASIPYNS